MQVMLTTLPFFTGRYVRGVLIHGGTGKVPADAPIIYSPSGVTYTSKAVSLTAMQWLVIGYVFRRGAIPLWGNAYHNISVVG